MNSNRNVYRYGIAAIMVAAVYLLIMAPAAFAKVKGQCAECHTMHNSQGGLPMALDAAGSIITSQTTPNDVLLRRSCVACHTGTNDGTNDIPYVNSTSVPNYGTDGTGSSTNTLAGGNFYWVAKGADSEGHNVTTDDLAGVDGTLGNNPPGLSSSGTFVGPLTCAGTTGCHGDPAATSDFAAISGTHHADDSTIDGTTVAKSYRFLDGVLGLEDSDWEYQPTSTAHNQYKGVDRTNEDDQSGTISSLCARCHNDFHNGNGNIGGTSPDTGTFASPWVRHPTDFDMANTAAGSEYRDYGGAGNTYQVSAPVASADVGTVLSTVNLTGAGNDEAIVTCISCHRAHGTPNADLLRWDYSTVEAGVDGTGACFSCHTTK